MYVCLCNSITERELAVQGAEGVTDAEEAYRRLGYKFDCGRCRKFAQMLLEKQAPGVTAISLVDRRTIRPAR